MAFIRWLGHASFEVFIAGKTLLFDPWFDERPRQVKRLVPPAVTEEKIRSCNLIFISHEHFDHCAPYDVNNIVKRTNALVIAPEESLALLNIPGRNRVEANAGDSFVLTGLDIEVVEARHPQSANPVGFIVGGEGKRVYFAGDTYDYYAMSEYEVDVALLPIGGTFCMDAIAALKALKTMRAKYVVPMTFNTFPQIAANATDFAARVRASTKTQPVLLKPGEGFDV